MSYKIVDLPKPERITRMIDRMFDHLPEIEADRAVLLTEPYKQT